MQERFVVTQARVVALIRFSATMQVEDQPEGYVVVAMIEVTGSAPVDDPTSRLLEELVLDYAARGIFTVGVTALAAVDSVTRRHGVHVRVLRGIVQEPDSGRWGSD